MYEGQTIQNISHGFGTLTKVYKDGTFKKIHTGQWVNGQKHGIGESWLNDGSYYSGDLFEGKKQGFGRIWLNDGSFYQGYWKNNLYDGVGMLIQCKFLNNFYCNFKVDDFLSLKFIFSQWKSI